jgi:hypothetical protein
MGLYKYENGQLVKLAGNYGTTQGGSSNSGSSIKSTILHSFQRQQTQTNGQTITLSDDVSNYDYLDVVVASEYSPSAYDTTIRLYPYQPSTSSSVVFQGMATCGFVDGSVVSFYFRTFEIRKTTVTLGGCYGFSQSSSFLSSTKNLIVYKVIGYKEE